MPHPFTWAPAEQERHAGFDPVPGLGYRPGTTIETLCGRQVVTDSGEYPWLWPTCAACDDRTREIVGVPSRAEVEKREAARATS